MTETGITVQEFLEISQVVNGQFDMLVNMIAIFLAASAFIVAVLVVFFTWRQFNVDKDVREYRDEIKRQKDNILVEGKKIQDEMRNELSEISEWAKEQKQQLEDELKKPLSEHTKEEIKNLEKKIDNIREEADVRKGVLSVRRRTSTSRRFTFPGISNNEDTEVIVCNNCGTVYVSTDDIMCRGVYGDIKCPNCEHYN